MSVDESRTGSEREGDRRPDSDEDDGHTKTSRNAPLGELSPVRARGEVIDVAVVPSGDVPDTFPVDIQTIEAVQLTLSLSETGTDEATAYIRWPATGPDEQFESLATVVGIPAHEPEQLVGVRLLLTIEDDHYVPILPPGAIRGDSRAIYGIYAGLVPSISIALFSFFGLGAVIESFLFFVLWLVGTFLVLPVSVYLDALHLKSTTDWDGNPVAWAIISAFPPVYVVTAPYYLLFLRANATPVATARRTRDSSEASN